MQPSMTNQPGQPNNNLAALFRGNQPVNAPGAQQMLPPITAAPPPVFAPPQRPMTPAQPATPGLHPHQQLVRANLGALHNPAMARMFMKNNPTVNVPQIKMMAAQMRPQQRSR